MRYLMSMSAVLAIAMPAWAQTPTATTHHRPTHRHNMYGMYGSRFQYSAADRLNAEELNVLQGGGPSVQRMPSGGRQLTDPYH